MRRNTLNCLRIMIHEVWRIYPRGDFFDVSAILNEQKICPEEAPGNGARGNTMATGDGGTLRKGL